MKSIMQHNFATTPKIDAPRSSFDMSHGHKTDFDAGWLIPLYHQEVIPGDTFNVNATIFARMSTPLYPIMDNMYLDSQFFFVPYRLLWDNWKKFCGEQTDPGDSIDYTIPVLEGSQASNNAGDLTTTSGRITKLMNYMGIPHGIAPDDVDISTLPFRAYSRIYNEWYRDQNLIDSQDAGLITDDGPDDNNLGVEQHVLQRRGKRRDYFTQALPWPQKGTAVTLPMGTSAPVQSDGTLFQMHNQTDSVGLVTNVGNTSPVFSAGITASSNLRFGKTNDVTATGLEVDLSSAIAPTINDIREAFQIQKLLERDARSGTRYSEVIKNHFNVDFYDVSYRPEFLGGGSTMININPVPYTATETSSTTYGGDVGAYGTVTAANHGFNKTFVEHGIVMGIISVRADLTYSQGLSRFFSHQTRYDKYWPTLSHLGEQSLLNKEIYCTGTATDDDVFGYVPRYDEYRVNLSKITGAFQSAATTSLDAWHFSQEFDSLPTLGQTFIEENPPVSRGLIVQTEPHFICDSYFNIRAARPIPTFGTPGLMDHF